MQSIRRALIVWLMAGLAVIAVLSACATYVAVRMEVDELLDLQLKQLAYSTQMDDLLRGRQPDLAPRRGSSGGDVTQLVTQIWDRDGVLVYWSQPGVGLRVPATPGYSTVHSDDRSWRVYTLVQGTHVLQVAQRQDERDAIATKTALRALLPFVVLLPLFGAMIWFAVGRGLRPLATMSHAVAKRRPDALAPLAERGLPQELQPLAGSLNELLSRLDAALGAQRRFTADAAHELRTPLAALKLQLDVARRAGDNPARLAAYDDLDAGVARASHLVDQLLTLARIEPEALATRAIDCDLVTLAKETIVARGGLAAEKGVDLGLARQADVRVHGDPASLAILLSNLLDNALRYTPAGGRIDVAIDAKGEGDRRHAVLTIADTGPGIPTEQRERVFDRFFRGPEGREPGSGLGLSIVKRIADAHHASITLDAPKRGSGLIVHVQFSAPSEAR